MGLNERQALCNFNLAPLNCRRDIAALGLVHRAVLKQGPPHFHQWFFLSEDVPRQHTRRQAGRHSKQLHTYWREGSTDYLRRSLLGQVEVYNRLEQYTVDAPCVKSFQKRLQNKLKTLAAQVNTSDDWKRLYTVRDSTGKPQLLHLDT